MPLIIDSCLYKGEEPDTNAFPTQQTKSFGQISVPPNQHLNSDRRLVANGMPSANLRAPRACLHPITIYRLTTSGLIWRLCSNLVQSLYVQRLCRVDVMARRHIRGL